MEAQNGISIEDEHYGIERVRHNALRESEVCAGYALDAEAVGDEGLAGFFREVQKTHEEIAERATAMIDGGEEKLPLAGTQARRGTPAEGDPGDVSPGQEDEVVARG